MNSIPKRSEGRVYASLLHCSLRLEACCCWMRAGVPNRSLSPDYQTGLRCAIIHAFVAVYVGLITRAQVIVSVREIVSSVSFVVFLSQLTNYWSYHEHERTWSQPLALRRSTNSDHVLSIKTWCIAEAMHLCIFHWAKKQCQITKIMPFLKFGVSSRLFERCEETCVSYAAILCILSLRLGKYRKPR